MTSRSGKWERQSRKTRAKARFSAKLAHNMTVALFRGPCSCKWEEHHTVRRIVLCPTHQDLKL